MTQHPFLHFGNGVVKHYRAMADRLGLERAGWLSYPTEAGALYDLALVAPGPIVEIGCYLGYSAAFLAMPGTQVVTTIDPHESSLRDRELDARTGDVDTLAEAKAAWSALGLDERIVAWPMTSAQASEEPTAPQEIGLLFIDGDHRPGAVDLDLELWAGRVVVGGYVALHDWGVRGDDTEPWDVAGCCERYFDRDQWMGPVLCGSIAYYRREA